MLVLCSAPAWRGCWLPAILDFSVAGTLRAELVPQDHLQTYRWASKQANAAPGLALKLEQGGS